MVVVVARGGVKRAGEPRLVRCAKCGYEWETKSSLVYVTCPSCLAKTKVQEVALP